MTSELVSNVISKLNSRGYSDVTAHDVIKNGVVLTGITIQNGTNITPCIYVDESMSYDDIDDVVNRVVSLYEEYKNPNINVECLSNHEWLLQHVYIALQRSSNEELIKDECYLENIEQFLYVGDKSEDDSHWSVKLNAYMMEYGDLDEEETWEAARVNTFASTTITPIGNIIAPMLGENASSILEDVPDMFVVSTNEGYYGAAAILDKEGISRYFEDSELNKFLIIPSSIHECIMIPVEDEEIDFDFVNEMIAEVNSTMVQPCEQLGDKAYYLEL